MKKTNRESWPKNNHIPLNMPRLQLLELDKNEKNHRGQFTFITSQSDRWVSNDSRSAAGVEKLRKVWDPRKLVGKVHDI